MTNWVSEGDRVESWGPFAGSSDQPVGTDQTSPGSQDTGPSVGSMPVKGRVPKEQPGQAAPAGFYCSLMACSHGDTNRQDGSADRPGSALGSLPMPASPSSLAKWLSLSASVVRTVGAQGLHRAGACDQVKLLSSDQAIISFPNMNREVWVTHRS
ncbi:hypothetical protein mRhiFer1_010097 [Rhinolophus ferrumequinum]|uniref:Uncharacterized protein n=1 Tax=Rhinolophus ferrumequinum TaxID=59479 RepID=A0A7J7XQD1_RHIFE|nr:hypothetical protein mRhiFer1_010097 [Rhinolophus ferrumequinum]